MEFNLGDKVALVTGAAHGLGKSIALKLAAQGARVAVNYHRHPERAAGVIQEIEDSWGVEALAVHCDMGSEADIVQMFKEVKRHWGGIDILVNNAAICPQAWVREMTTALWNQVLQVNLTGTFIACREMMQHLVTGGRPGRIVNITSSAAFNGSTSGQAAYDASKGGITALTVSLAREGAPHGITANALAPGLMLTDMVKERFLANEEKYLARIPMNRFGETDEVASAVVFLCSGEASYITGTTLNVTGGLMMR